MAYKVIRAKQSFVHHKAECKKGDQIEVEEKDAELLIARGLAEPGEAPHNAPHQQPLSDTPMADTKMGSYTVPHNKDAPQHSDK